MDQKNILYNKDIGFRGGYSIDNLSTELVDNNFSPFNNKRYFLGVYESIKRVHYCRWWKFAENILLYDVQENLFKWCENNFSNREEYIEGKRMNISCLNIKFSVLQCLYLGHGTFKVLETVLLAGDTDFCSYKGTKQWFQTVRFEIGNICSLFKANSFSLNEDKTKYIFYFILFLLCTSFYFTLCHK